MSLLPQAKLDALSPEEMWATNADTPSSFKEYLGLSFGQGIEESALGAATSVGPDYQPPMSGGIFGQPAVQQPSGTPKLSEDQWKASKNYRQEIPYDPGMTEARAEFLRQQFDRRRWRDSVYERYQGGLMGRAAGIGAMLAGGALAPENYIPILGPASRAYMAARLGRVGAYAAVGAAEGAIGNLAVAPYIYQGLAAQGEDVGIEDVALDVAMGAVLGSAFSTGVGVVGDRLARSRAMREAAVSGRGATVHTAADALNLAADAVERGDVPDVARVVAPEVERARGVVERMPDPEAPPVQVDALKVERSKAETAYRLGEADPEDLEPYTEFRAQIEATPEDFANIQAHGIVSGDADQQLVDLLRKGVDPNREFNTGDLAAALDPTVRAAGLGAKVEAPYVVLGRPGQDIKTDGIAAVVVNGAAKVNAEALRKAFPNVDILTPDQVSGWAKQAASAPSPKMRGAAASRASSTSAAKGVDTVDPRPLDPDPEPPSVTEAAARVGKDTPELQQFVEDMGLEDSSVVDMDLNELRRAGTLTAEDEAALQAAADDVKMAESVALSYETLSTCVLRYGT